MAHGPGRWVQDREYGQQFRAEILTSTPPTTRKVSRNTLAAAWLRASGLSVPRSASPNLATEFLTLSRKSLAAWRMWAASAQIVKNRLLQDLILGIRFQFS